MLSPMASAGWQRVKKVLLEIGLFITWPLWIWGSMAKKVIRSAGREWEKGRRDSQQFRLVRAVARGE
jgi:hypothetical protein